VEFFEDAPAATEDGGLDSRPGFAATAATRQEAGWGSGVVDLPDYTPVGPVQPCPVARVHTQRSLWLIDADVYIRMPRHGERPDPARDVWSDWGRLDDLVRHPYRRAWWSIDPAGVLVVRIHPVAGPPNGAGIISGPVVAVTGIAPTDPLHATPIHHP
jgi:hypothetical protein